MKSRRLTIRAGTLVPLTLCVLSGLSGCQVGRTFFQMDSNAAVPFMGMDLLPKRKSGSPTDGVSRFQNAAVSGKPASRAAAVETPTVSSRLSKLLGREPLTLPASTASEDHAAISQAPVEEFR